MKVVLYFSTLAVLLGACSSSQNFTRAEEDDIYYIPGKQSLFVQEVKKKTGVVIPSNTSLRSEADNVNNHDKVYPKETDNSINTKSYAIGMARYATEKQVQKEETRTGTTVNRVTVPANDGYWIGGFKGSENDLDECVRIMNRYPEGFAYFGNGYEIAQNLSFSSDWNVYTIDNRYWWFPSSSNVGLYTQLIFGNYPKYIWTVIWNDPRFDSFAWSNDISFGWNRWGWGTSFGWRNSWGWDPFWSPYYANTPWGWRHDFYRPWDWNHHYGYHPHQGFRPEQKPHWNNRPNGNNTQKPYTTTRYAPKKQYTTNRNSRSYSTSSRTSRNSTTQSRPNNNRYDSNSHFTPNRNTGNSSSGGYSKGNNNPSSYGNSSSPRTNRGGSGPVQRTNSGSRR